MMAVSMEKPKFVEPLQHALASFKIIWPKALSPLDLLQDEANYSAFLGDICQEFRSDTLAQYLFVDVAFQLDVWDLVAETSDFDNNWTFEQIRW